MELLQRFYTNKQVSDHAYHLAEDLYYENHMDPFGGCLAGYTMIALNRTEDIHYVASRMMESYDSLSDTHIINASNLAGRGADKKSIVASYERAMDFGFPLFTLGLQKLISGLDEYEIQHPRAKLFRTAFTNRVRGMLWTAWMQS